MLGTAARSATDMKCAHGQLRTGLTNRLRRDDADRFSHVRHPPPGQITAITADADTSSRLTCQRRPDPHPLQTGLLDECHPFFINLFVGADQHLIGEGITDVFEGHAPQHPFPQPFDDLPSFYQRGHFDPIDGATIVLADDGVLGHIHQSACQVAGIGGLERRIGQPLARTVGRDKVLQHRQAFAKVSGDRRFDNLPGGLGHQAAHPRQLTDLLGTATRPGVRHHIDGIEPALTLAQAVKHLVSDFVSHGRPGIDHFVVAFSVSDQSLGVLFLNFLESPLGFCQELPFGCGNRHVLDANRYTRPGRIFKPEIFEAISKDDCALVPRFTKGSIDQSAQLLLLHHPVDLSKRDLGRNHISQQDPPDRRLNQRSINPGLDPGLQMYRTLVVGNAHFVGAAEDFPLSESAWPFAGHGIEPEHNILGWPDDGFAVRRRQDVIRRHHQDTGFDLGLDREGDVDRHLVAVEIGVVGHADQGMELDCLSLNQDRFEGLDAQTVQRRRPIEQDRVLAGHLIQDVPDFRPLLLHHLLGAFDSGRIAALFQFVVNERLEELQRHVLRQAALMKA